MGIVSVLFEEISIQQRQRMNTSGFWGNFPAVIYTQLGKFTEGGGTLAPAPPSPQLQQDSAT
jgi:hypothetical protein